MVGRQTQHGSCGCAEDSGHPLPRPAYAHRHNQGKVGEPVRGELVTAGETVDEQIGLTTAGDLRSAEADRTQRRTFPMVQFDGSLCHDVLAVSNEELGVPSGGLGVPSGGHGVPSGGHGVPSGGHGVPSGGHGAG